MKKNIITLVLLTFISVFAFAQEEATEETTAKEKDYPVSATFESGVLIDAQTIVIPDKKTLEMVIQHKFAPVKNGLTDLWGIYGAGTGIRLSLNYVPIKNFQVGAGITKRYMTTDVNAKWTVLQQTRNNTIPVSVALFGVAAIDGRDKADFAENVFVGSPVGEINKFKFEDRFSYFSQLIVARKFNEWFSLQAGLSFSHYNLTNYKEAGKQFDHDKVGAHLSGRIKVSPQGSLIFNYDAPLKIKEISEQGEWTDQYPHPKPNLSFGYEISTGTHAFQIYMGSSSFMLPQENMLWNQNELNKNSFAIGFTMTRLWAY